MSWTRLIACIALAVAAGLPAWAAPEGRLVRLPDGRRIYLQCMGQGAPTVLFEGGYLADSGAWFKVQPQVARITRACAYDRAGYGRSDPGPLPRDGKAVARDLDQALRAGRIDGPFVLVGHSAGGLYGQLFADRRPRQVVGMVLSDPSAEYQDKRFAAVFGPGAGSTEPLRARDAACLEAAEHGKLPSTEPALAACTPKPRPPNALGGQSEASQAAALAQALKVSRWRTAVSELETLWTLTSDEVARGQTTYGAMPLIVLTADGTNAGTPPAARAAVDGLWRQLHRETAAKSSRGEERLVTGSSHMMMLDRPDAIVQAVTEVVQAARADSPHR